VQTATLSRKFERERIGTLSLAPRECRTFYAASQANRPFYEMEMDAMMVALDQHLPTINGHSGLYPPGWDLDPTAPDYEQRAMHWALKRGIAPGLCRVDVDNRNWILVPVDHDWTCVPAGCVRDISFDQSHEFEIVLKQGGNSALFTDDDWDGEETWGRWTIAKQAALTFAIGAPRALSFEIAVGALLSASAPKQSVWIEANQCRVSGTEFDLMHSGEQTISGVIPASCIDANGKVELRINTDRVQSPKEIGLNNDLRKLGVSVKRVVLTATSLPLLDHDLRKRRSVP
jgi:hypothetical protein